MKMKMNADPFQKPSQSFRPYRAFHSSLSCKGRFRESLHPQNLTFYFCSLFFQTGMPSGKRTAIRLKRGLPVFEAFDQIRGNQDAVGLASRGSMNLSPAAEFLHPRQVTMPKSARFLKTLLGTDLI
jgi:hypothetical protein